MIQSCEIEGSSDQSIQNVIPNDLQPILEKSQIQAIFTTGKKAYHLYQKYIYPKTKIKAISLPSTSPAYCKKGVLEELVQEYQKSFHIRMIQENNSILKMVNCMKELYFGGGCFGVYKIILIVFRE